MADVIGAAAVLVGIVLFWVSVKVVLEANPRSVVPLWLGSPPVAPRRAYAFRAAGVGSWMLGVLMVSTPGFFVALVVTSVLAIPMGVMMRRHHHRAAKAQVSP